MCIRDRHIGERIVLVADIGPRAADHALDNGGETNAGTKAAFTFVSERGAPFNDVIEFRSPPPAVQRTLFAALTPIARSWISSWTWSTAKAGSAVSARRIA